MFLCSIYHGIYLSIKGEEFTSQEIICDTFSTTASCRKATVTQRSTKNILTGNEDTDNDEITMQTCLCQAPKL